jgi:hypothetical protein
MSHYLNHWVKKMRNLVLALVGVAALAFTVGAEDKKEVKLDGEMVCGKCKLKETTECSNVVQVKDGDKVVKYYLDDKGSKEEYHKLCCTKAVNVTVTGGEITEKDGKKSLKGAKVEEKK